MVIRNLHHRKFTMRLLPHKRSLTMMITTENMQINGTKFAGKNVEFCVKVIGGLLTSLPVLFASQFS